MPGNIVSGSKNAGITALLLENQDLAQRFKGWKLFFTRLYCYYHRLLRRTLHRSVILFSKKRLPFEGSIFTFYRHALLAACFLLLNFYR